MRFLIKFPTRSRPVQFLAALHQYLDMLSGKHDVEILVSIDNDDEAMNTPEMYVRITKDSRVRLDIGYSKSKIEAINRAINPSTFDILVLASDDMIPVAHGYDDVIASNMLLHFPNLDGALHFPDGHRTDIITFSIMGVNLYRRFGYVYHPEYLSLWCDNEFTEVVKRLKKYAFVNKVIVFHDHPYFTKRQSDDLLKKNESHFASDENTFKRHMAQNFDIPRLESNQASV